MYGCSNIFLVKGSFMCARRTFPYIYLLALFVVVCMAYNHFWVIIIIIIIIMVANV